MLETLESMDDILYPDRLGLRLLFELPMVIVIDCGDYFYPGVWGCPKVDTLSTSTPAKNLSRCVAVRFSAFDGSISGIPGCFSCVCIMI